MFCTHCGKENPEENAFCMYCGTPLHPRLEGSPDSDEQDGALHEATRDAPIASTPTTPPPSFTKHPPRSRYKLYLAGGSVAFLGIVCLFLGILIVPRLLGNSSSNHIVLAFPNNSGEADIYVLRLGQEKGEGRLIAENVTLSNRTWFGVFTNGIGQPIGSRYGGFIPDSKLVLFSYKDDDDFRVNIWGLGDREISEILDSGAERLFGRVLDDSTLFIREDRVTGQRCYISKRGQKAKRLDKADSCGIVQTGELVYFENVDDDETTLVFMDLNGEEQGVALDGVKDVESFRISDDGSHVAYVQRADGEQRLILVNREDNENIELSGDVFAIVDYGFASNSNVLFYLLENDDGELELYTSTDATPLAVGTSLRADFGPEGRYLVYTVGDEDNEYTLYVYDMRRNVSLEVLQGGILEFAILPNPANILIREVQSDEVIVYSLKIDGSGLTELYNEDDVTLTRVYYLPDDPTLYMVVREEDNTNSLFIVPINRAEGFYLLQEWDKFDLLNISPNGRQLVFVGIEDRGDDPILYLIELEKGADPIELDDDNEGFPNAVFTSDGKSILYTAVTGNTPDDVDVNLVPTNGEERYQTLYRDAFLADIRWDDMEPFYIAFWQNGFRGTSYCPGAIGLQVGTIIEDDLANGEQVCFRFRASEGDVVTFVVTSPLAQRYDFGLTLYDRDGRKIDTNMDGPAGDDPRLTVVIPKTGLYFLKLTGFGSEDRPTYTLAMRAGLGDPALDNAQLIQPGERKRGALTNNSDVYLETYDSVVFSDIYYFEGQAGDVVTVNVFADSLGSSLDPRVVLFDQLLNELISDDDSGAGLDSQFTFTLPESGRYYLFVFGNTGNAATNFYEIQLDIR